MLAQGGGRLYVVVIQGHNGVNAIGASQVADGVEVVRPATQIGHQKDLVDTLARPWLRSDILAGQ